MTTECPHGGRFYNALGDRLENLGRLSDIIPADVLDAWFPPAPSVLDALSDSLPWLAKTSPPVHAEPLAEALGEFLSIDKHAVLPGPGSSSLIFLALTRWLNSQTRVWIPDPGYGEYRHVANLMGAKVDGQPLWPAGGMSSIQAAIRGDYDLVVIVNPNNPTGWSATASDLVEVLSQRSPNTKIWIDEAYAAYMPEIGSLAPWAATQRGVFVSRTLSKSHSLSGLRAACLIAHPDELASLRKFMPPWSVSFPGQVASIQALREQNYYRQRYAETVATRENFTTFLVKIGFKVLASEANWILAHHDQANQVVREAESRGIYIRDPANMSSQPWPGTLRIAVRSVEETQRMGEALQQILQDLQPNFPRVS
jgi:histidinol-phosphate/aromatic aminotransferase/cobyric acid decarboxylase-like protein